MKNLSKSNIESFNIDKALKDKMVSGVEIKAPIRKFTERVSNKNTEVYYIYNKSTGDKYQLYNDKDCNTNYDPKCGVKVTNTKIEKAANSKIPASNSTSTSSLNSSSYSYSVPLSKRHRLN